MATAIDLLRGIGEQAAPDGAQALRGPVALAARPARAVRLAISPALDTVWQAATGRPFEAAHAVALAATQIGEPVAIMAHGAASPQDLALVTLARLLATNTNRALWVVPDRGGAERAATLLGETAGALRIPWHIVPEVSTRATTSRLVIATLGDLDQRLLPYGERAWHWLWTRLELLVVTDLDRLDAGSLQRLAWLARRVERFAPSPIRLLAGFSPCVAPEQMLAGVFERDFRVIDAEPTRGPTMVAIWYCADRRAAITQLAGALLDRRLAITVLGRDAAETQKLRITLADNPSLVIGLDANRASIALVYGVPCDAAERAALVRAGYRLIIMLAAGEPHEPRFAAQPELALDGIITVPHMAEDTGVASRQILWAAAELPLESPEVTRWRMAPVVEQLVAQGLLSAMPDGRLQPGVASVERILSPLVSVGDEPPAEMREPVSDLSAPLPSTVHPDSPVPEPIDDLSWEPTVVAMDVAVPVEDVVWGPGIDPDDVEDIHWGSTDPMPTNSLVEAAPDEYLLESLLEEPPPKPRAPSTEPTSAPPTPDVESMIARMRRLREQRESEKAAPPTNSTPGLAADTRQALRFRSGQRVRAIPYGAGIVRDARLVDGREQLTVRFSDAGDITLDPAVSAVRVLDESIPAKGGDD